MLFLQEGRFQVVYSLADCLAKSIIAFSLMDNDIQSFIQVISCKQVISQIFEVLAR